MRSPPGRLGRPERSAWRACGSASRPGRPVGLPGRLLASRPCMRLHLRHVDLNRPQETYRNRLSWHGTRFRGFITCSMFRTRSMFGVPDAFRTSVCVCIYIYIYIYIHIGADVSDANAFRTPEHVPYANNVRCQLRTIPTVSQEEARLIGYEQWNIRRLPIRFE